MSEMQIARPPWRAHDGPSFTRASARQFIAPALHARVYYFYIPLASVDYSFAGKML
ncbi:hypothetical protein CHELA20_53302 [Hyphomicrobiales bacterium]|nr:hypothetical protein CHELA20_53302 [Hyphomicrobiales bacterium]